jgi:alpha-glucosidase
MTWWQEAVFYQIYPRSFLDTDGDGIGDLEGVRRKIDYFVQLGIDAIWMSPIFPSPMKDFGYDVANYCDVDALFGSLESFDRLISECHEVGIKVILDWVPNHSSAEHPWFVEARSSTTNPKRDWYVWRSAEPSGALPNNWLRSWSDEPAWTLDATTNEFYLHCFLPDQPDLNWANLQVRHAMADTLRFWLDRGVDGFRMDVIHLIGKDPELPDDPDELRGIGHVPLNDRVESHGYLREIRSVLDEYRGDKVAVGEVYLLDPEAVADYYGTNDELHLSFNFASLVTPWRAENWRALIERTENSHNRVGGWPTWVLSNHDNQRIATRLKGDRARIRAAAVLLLTLRGTPFLYAGEELALHDAHIAVDQVVDPGKRDGCRAPIPWTVDALHGWPAPPWLPFADAAEQFSVEAQELDDTSMLHFVRILLSIRRANDALRLGDLVDLAADNDVLSFERVHGDDRVGVLVNFSREPRDVSATSARREISNLTTAVARDLDTKTLAPGEAVIRLF